MMQTVDAREVIERQAQTEPHAISAYRDFQHFEETIGEAAARIMRWSGLRLQWYVLTVGGVLLIVLTLLKLFAIEIIYESGAFLSGPKLLVAWAVALGWTWLYNLQVRGLSQRIIDRRLCLRCGKSLLDAALDEHGSGVCPNCCVVFKLGEYIPPTDCIEAMRRVRSRTSTLRRNAPHSTPRSPRPPSPSLLKPPRVTDPRFGPLLGLYEDRLQFDKVIQRAASRLILHNDGGIVIIIGMFAGSVPLLMFFLEGSVLGLRWLWLTSGLTVFLSILIAYCLVRHYVYRSLILDYKLCLSCGYSLKEQRTNDHGVGRCPVCSRIFHAREFIAPGTDVKNPDWQQTRRELFKSLNRDNLKELVIPDDHEPHLHSVEDPPGSGKYSRLRRCKACYYIIEGSPVNEKGQGVCSECGKAFVR